MKKERGVRNFLVKFESCWNFEEFPRLFVFVMYFYYIKRYEFSELFL